MLANKFDYQITKDGFWFNVLIKPSDVIKAQQFIDNAKDKEYDITIKEHHEKRSPDANAYLWLIIGEIAKKTGTYKNDIYREAVRNAGNCYVIPIKNEQADEFTKKWSRKGEGWFVSDSYPSPTIKDHTTFICYYGTSVYDSKEMFRVTEYIVEEAHGLGIETDTPDQIAKRISLWDSRE